MCLIDIELFFILEVKWKEKKILDEEFKFFVLRVEKFYGIMFLLRGKMFEEVSKEKIEVVLFFGFEKDERVCFIYRVVVLNKGSDL